MLGLVWIRILGLFGLMFDFFWDYSGSLGQSPFLGIWCFWDSMLGALGLHFGSLEPSQRVDFGGLGLTSGSIFGDF